MVGATIKRRKKMFLILVFITTIMIMIFLKIYEKNKDKHSNKIIRRNNNEYFYKNGINVIVGHYIGKTNFNLSNASSDFLNKNNFSPEPNAGKNGQPVVIQSKDIIKMQQLYPINQFNLLVSDKIPLNRTLPDYRQKKCTKLFKDFLTYPKTSIIIVFHNEAWSTLLRTVWSIINRSPKKLIAEIILVDDASERDFLKKPLDDYIRSLPIKVVIIRSTTRIGLIKARLKGALAAEGEVLTFLDAHCECTIGWLEPLLSVINSNKKTVICPTIDIINDDTFAYIKSFELHWGAFNWNLQFRWFTLGENEIKLRKNDITQPFNTPVMAGGLFAIDKKFFFEMGAYDEHMLIWGGENLEMSFRIWQCGGKIKISPCSRVGHLFRKSSPYGFPGGLDKTLFSNLARVALVWLDEWADFFFKFNKQPRSTAVSVSVAQHFNSLTHDISLVTLCSTERKTVRPENWEVGEEQSKYITTIGTKKTIKMPKFLMVFKQHLASAFFSKRRQIFWKDKNLGKNLCLLKPERNGISNQPVGVAKIDICLGDDVKIEMFVMTPDGFIMTDDSLCLDAPDRMNIDSPKVRIIACHGFPRQKWNYNQKTKEVLHISTNKCLDVNDTNKELLLKTCDGNKHQKWSLDSVPWK